MLAKKEWQIQWRVACCDLSQAQIQQMFIFIEE
jgi:hypothetical protein